MIRGGNNYVSAPPAFSNDASKILVCSANTVSIFNTSTGLLIGELEGHIALVSSVIVVLATSAGGKVLCYCWTSSLDGTIRYWDFIVPELMKTIDIQFPVSSMVIPSFLSQPREGNANQGTSLPIYALFIQYCVFRGWHDLCCSCCVTLSFSVDRLNIRYFRWHNYYVGTWFARKATNGEIALVNSSQVFEENKSNEQETDLLAYMNNDRRFGYAFVYGELPEFKLGKHEDAIIKSMPRGGIGILYLVVLLILFLG